MTRESAKQGAARADRFSQVIRPLLHLEGSAGYASSILRALHTENPQTLLFTSCHASEGKTTAAINVAFALTREAGKRVLLIDANASNPALHTLFDMKTSPGLVDLVMDEVKIPDVLYSAGTENLSVMPIGSNPDKWLSWSPPNYLERELIKLKDHFDLILVDGPSIFGPIDTALFASEFDGVVLIVECERTRREVVSYAEERLLQSDARILGVIMNRRKYYIPEALYEE